MEAGRWEFSLSSLVGAFVYCSVACCGETALKLGSGDKHLHYALNKLFGLLSSNPVYITNTLWCARLIGKVSGRRWSQLGWALWFPGRLEFDVALSLASVFFFFTSLIDLFSVFRWLDGLVAVVGL